MAKGPRMAALTADDYRQIRKSVYSPGHGKEELKARASLPNETQAMAVFQALEDATIAHFTATIKPAIDANIGGAATTTILAKKIYAGYLLWKINELLGI
jgi:hypothetical protein